MNASPREAEPPLLEARGGRKTFGDVTVLDGVDLAVRRGETVVVVGGSGSARARSRTSSWVSSCRRRAASSSMATTCTL